MEVSKRSKCSLAAKATAIRTILYIPINATPDFILVIGLMDDAGVVALATTNSWMALNKYR